METSNQTWLAHIEELKNKAWEVRDPRVDGWFLMSSPVPTILICLFYVYLVKVWGPNYMKDRKPMDLHRFLLGYNFLQVLLSAYIFIQGLRAGWWGDYNVFCQPVDKSDNPKALFMVHCVWAFYMSKFTEFIDTFCFIARKKFNQVTLLHVYHHGVMPVSAWFGLRFVPGGHGTLLGLINAFVHVIMYTYYLVAGMGPQYQKYLWWKQYLTSLQMIQFVIIIGHAVQLVFYDDCDFPVWFAYFVIAQTFVILAMFAHFYVQAYLTPKKKLKVDDFTPSKNGHASGNVALSNGKSDSIKLKKAKLN